MDFVPGRMVSSREGVYAGGVERSLSAGFAAQSASLDIILYDAVCPHLREPLTS